MTEQQPLLSYSPLNRGRQLVGSESTNSTSSSTTRVPTVPVSRAPSYGAVKRNNPNDPEHENENDDGDLEASILDIDNDRIKRHEGERLRSTFREIWPVLMGLATSSFSAALGATIVANLQIEIGSHFHAGSLASWLGTAYLLGLVAVTPLYGRLAQIIGRKGSMILALSLYLAGTLLSAAAPSMYAILAARIVAGAGGGGLLTLTAIIVTDLVSIADRGLYQGFLNLLWGAGSASGAFLGGYIADNLGWRAAFWLQVPLVVFSTVIVAWKVNVRREEDEDQGGDTAWEKIKGIDWAGCIVLTIGIASLSTLSSLLTSPLHTFSDPLPLTLFITALVAIPVFILIERSATSPVLPLQMILQPQILLILIGFVFTTATNFSRTYMQPVYLHVARGLTGSETGLILLPASAAGSFAGLYAGWHMRHFREYKWFQATISLVPWLQALSIMVGWGLNTNVHRLWIELVVGSLGQGATMTTLMTAMVACVEASELSLAISACYLFRAVGQVLGVAVSALIQQSVLRSSLFRRFPSNPELVREIIQEPAEILPTLNGWTGRQAREAYLDSIRGVFGFIAFGGIVLTLICLNVRGKRL